ncbi:ectonucleotide pyrophosphatase/phosphodiesterase [Caulobacter sp. UNC279MFTsu5.1]|uniref:alkaline phosphatase family protein n=1 Tax=Caulobacter sp. UNC279MFTsu5.1 TaxID=1502775 RepID=UPI0008F3DF97|nr:ectonucleotide pyrophosphatase/phosphodiesterase [Caulobacter sp. UNC279MFTsu5.1]SFJ76391.1 Predicted pyrophosphatase or phosphodiesterase, AlkP superfamily [Caulobacter sp. UNC279MFTsu5.1]
MVVVYRWMALILALMLGACASIPQAEPAKAPTKSALTILISLDGFRPDYLDRGDTPTLSALAADGARGAMRPSFPSLTYPNHYTLVTGKRPDHHGMVNNTLEDEAIPGVSFSMSNHDAVGDGRWWSQARPIWVSAEQQGVHAGVLFWPGSEAAIDGVRPSYWKVYDEKLAYADRVDAVLSWIDAKAPPLGLATLYFDATDTEGHHYGPDSPEVNAAAAKVDAAIGRLVEGLKARGLYATTNIVVVADHGMAPQPLSRLVDVATLVDPAKARFVSTGSIVGVRALPGFEAEVKAAMLKPHDHLTCWEKGKIPARYAYGTNPRVPPIVCLAERGWYFATASAIAKRWKEHPRDGGAHGYDPFDPAMRAVFVAHGPAFRSGVVLSVFDNVDVYPLLTRLIGVKGDKGDGSLGPVKAALR